MLPLLDALSCFSSLHSLGLVDGNTAGESRRIVMKEVLKTQGGDVEIKSRAVPQSAIDHYR